MAGLASAASGQDSMLTLSTTATYTAPSWLPGNNRWPVEQLAKPHHGNVLVRWQAGPLKGREARLGVKTLVKLNEVEG